GNILGAPGMERRRRTGEADRLAAEYRLAPVGFDQLNLRHPENRQDQAGQAGAAAEIDDAPRAGRQMAHELRGIEDMTLPDVADCIPADQIDAPVPGREQTDIVLEPRHCFT